jgi:hypothetical protein
VNELHRQLPSMSVRSQGCLEACHFVGLRTLLPVDDVEGHRFSFFEALVTLCLDGTEVDKDVGAAIIPAQEAVPFCIVKPLHLAFVLCQAIPPPKTVKNMGRDPAILARTLPTGVNEFRAGPNRSDM